MKINTADEIEIEDWMSELPILNSEKEINLDDTQFIQSDNSEMYRQKCHICDQFFVNLERHFSSSHLKEELISNDENGDHHFYVTKVKHIHVNCYVKAEQLEIKKKNVSIISAGIPENLKDSNYYDFLDAQKPVEKSHSLSESDEKFEDIACNINAIQSYFSIIND